MFNRRNHWIIIIWHKKWHVQHCGLTMFIQQNPSQKYIFLKFNQIKYPINYMFIPFKSISKILAPHWPSQGSVTTSVVGFGTHWCAPTSVRPGHPGVEPRPASPQTRRFSRWSPSYKKGLLKWLKNGWNHSLWWFNHDDICMFDILFFI